MSEETLHDASMRERLSYVEDEMFSDAKWLTVREAESDEWGDIAVVVGEDVWFQDTDDKSLEEWAKLAAKHEDEFFFEKVMYKHPTWMKDTICLSFQSIEDNVFRD